MANGKALLEGIARAITGDRAELEKVCSPDIDFRDSVMTVKGIAGVSEYFTSWWTAFPNAKGSVSNLIESGDTVAGEMAYAGTQTGPMASPQGEIPATGRAVDLHGACFITVADGKITSFRGYYDTGAMMAQLGLMPAPAGA